MMWVRSTILNYTIFFTFHSDTGMRIGGKFPDFCNSRPCGIVRKIVSSSLCRTGNFPIFLTMPHGLELQESPLQKSPLLYLNSYAHIKVFHAHSHANNSIMHKALWQHKPNLISSDLLVMNLNNFPKSFSPKFWDKNTYSYIPPFPPPFTFLLSE